MFKGLFSSTVTLTGKLAVFFACVSLVVGAFAFLVFLAALRWSEDRMAERRILIDRNAAVDRYLAGEQGRLDIDALTVAYDSLSLVPEPYKTFLANHRVYLGEKDFRNEPLSYMIYKGFFFKHGKQQDIILFSYVDSVEFDANEILYTGVVVVALVTFLMLLFGGLLFRLSKRLIEPLNDIVLQLERQSGNTEASFSINEDAAGEFQSLTQCLNQYRRELNLVLKREQAFARYASHELRTALTVIKGANKLLLRSGHRPFQERQIFRIDDATNQMITIIDALLALVKYENSENDRPSREVSAPEMERIVSNNTVQHVLKKVSVDLEIESLPLIKASPPVLNMVVGNLLRNATAATTEGTINLRLTSKDLTVTDDGPGLSDESGQEGHGLGLLIVRDLCSRYGWQFELFNHQSRGCVARIIFADHEESEDF